MTILPLSATSMALTPAPPLQSLRMVSQLLTPITFHGTVKISCCFMLFLHLSTRLSFLLFHLLQQLKRHGIVYLSFMQKIPLHTLSISKISYQWLLVALYQLLNFSSPSNRLQTSLLPLETRLGSWSSCLHNSWPWTCTQRTHHNHVTLGFSCSFWRIIWQNY